MLPQAFTPARSTALALQSPRSSAASSHVSCAGRRPAGADALAPVGDGVGERPLERDLRLPAGRRAQPAGVAAHLHHLVGAHAAPGRPSCSTARPATSASAATSSRAERLTPEQTL